MMFAYSFKLPEAAALIEQAIENTLEGGYRTADIFSEGMLLVSTTEMRDKVLEALKQLIETRSK
jgi:3-isopropylmalate dehydrogenase